MDPAAKVFAPWLGVFETLRVIEGVPLFVPEHLAELSRAADALGLKVTFDPAKARAELPSRSGRWRWITTPEGTRTLFSEEEISSAAVDLSVSTIRVGSENWDARFKTVSYLSHAQAVQTASTMEVILLNEHRNVASAGRSNLFWRRGGRLFTPAHEAGCRRGVVRDFVLQRRDVEEGEFPLDDLLAAEEVFLTNSLRGIVSVFAVEGGALETVSAADALRTEYDEAVKKQLGR